MARKGALAKNPPPLRGEARKEFKAAKQAAVAAGQPVPSQDQFRPKAAPPAQTGMRPLPGPGMQVPQGFNNDLALRRDFSSAERDASINAVAQSLNQAQNSPIGQQVGQMLPDKMMRFSQMPQMPQPSANNGGQYRLSPGVYGNQQQAMQQYNEQMQQMPGLQNGLGQGGNLPSSIDWSQMIPYGQRRG
jgi:hypothetical protein